MDAEGNITIRGDAVEMGNGIGTALANRVATHLGRVSDAVGVAEIDAFDALDLVTSGDPYSMTQAAQDEAAANPRWVPAITSATSASIGAHVGTRGGGRGGAGAVPLRPVAGGARHLGHRRQAIRVPASGTRPSGRTAIWWCPG